MSALRVLLVAAALCGVNEGFTPVVFVPAVGMERLGVVSGSETKSIAIERAGRPFVEDGAVKDDGLGKWPWERLSLGASINLHSTRAVHASGPHEAHSWLDNRIELFRTQHWQAELWTRIMFQTHVEGSQNGRSLSEVHDGIFNSGFMIWVRDHEAPPFDFFDKEIRPFQGAQRVFSRISGTQGCACRLPRELLRLASVDCLLTRYFLREVERPLCGIGRLKRTVCGLFREDYSSSESHKTKEANERASVKLTTRYAGLVLSSFRLPPALAFLITLAALISAAKLVLDGFWYRDWFLLAGGVAAACVGFFTVQQIAP